MLARNYTPTRLSVHVCNLHRSAWRHKAVVSKIASCSQTQLYLSVVVYVSVCFSFYVHVHVSTRTHSLYYSVHVYEMCYTCTCTYHYRDNLGSKRPPPSPRARIFPFSCRCLPPPCRWERGAKREKERFRLRYFRVNAPVRLNKATVCVEDYLICYVLLTNHKQPQRKLSVDRPAGSGTTVAVAGVFCQLKWIPHWSSSAPFTVYCDRDIYIKWLELYPLLQVSAFETYAVGLITNLGSDTWPCTL